MEPRNEFDIILHPATPALEDGLAYARFLDQAADGFFGVMLGKRYADVMADTFATPAHDFSFENVIFAEQDAMIVGMASGFTAKQHHGCSDEVLVKAKGYPSFRMAMFQLVFGSLWRFLDTIEDGEFYLQAVAVEEELRGKGVGSMLIDAMETRAINSTASRFLLDVAGKNEAAQRLYESRGMTVGARWPKRFFLPKFQIVRMTKSIEPATVTY